MKITRISSCKQTKVETWKGFALKCNMRDSADSFFQAFYKTPQEISDTNSNLFLIDQLIYLVFVYLIWCFSINANKSEVPAR